MDIRATSDFVPDRITQEEFRGNRNLPQWPYTATNLRTTSAEIWFMLYGLVIRF